MRLQLAFILLLASAVSSLRAESLTYEKDIRPIFRAHCFDCHGAVEKLEGELDLRLVRFMAKGGESGPAIVPGKPQDSYLLARIRSGEMPPGEKKVSSQEIAVIERWLAAGAATARPEPKTIGPGLGVTPEERSYWAFQPIRRPQASTLDALTLQTGKLSPEADRRTLILRAYFTLIGLPPSPEELQTWTDASGQDWFERLLDELLKSPHYGERWGRHWLDVAGYADSEGYTVADTERPWAWKYRDWVIRALNDDKPFDRFITEQLAGDELAGPKQGDWKAEQIDLLAATGFLRMAADGTGGGNNNEARNQVLADTMKIVGASLLGLSLQCAQCHDHRYDPIPQTDYYALRAVFEPALDWKAWKVPNARRVSLYTEADRKKAAQIEAEAKKIEAERKVKQDEYMKQALDKELKKYKEPLRGQLRKAYETPSKDRSEEQKKLFAQYPSLNITTGNLYQYIAESRPKLAEYSKRIEATRKKKPVEEFLRALVEPANHAPETKLFHRGDYRQPKQTISPASLTVAAPEGADFHLPANDPSLPSTGRRLALARWLTKRENPLFARVIVNRVWMHHFGKGLVATPADFGKLGSRPSHPQLLDWLADEFIAQRWSLKKLHRTIMTSATWRQARTQSAPFRQSLPRLEAEVLRDRMLAASGRLDRRLFGQPLKIKRDASGQVIVDGEQTRRSLYIQVRRSQPVAMLQTFDAPVMETNCESRAHSTVATQSLMLLNGPFILDQAAKLADRVSQEAEPLNAAQLDGLPALAPRRQAWRYGVGYYDQKTNRTEGFQEFPHWNGSRWQGGEEAPDSQWGWAFLTSAGGHTGSTKYSVIRRWTATAEGAIDVRGNAHHPSPNGDGVRCRIVSSRSGKAGEWIVQKASTETKLDRLLVRAGDTIDFITDCRESVTSDSFSWTFSIALKTAGKADQTFASDKQFRGPGDSLQKLPGQIVRAWKLAYCREPSREELALAIGFLGKQIDALDASPQAVPQGRSVVRQAMTNLCQSLLSSNEFLYVE